MDTHFGDASVPPQEKNDELISGFILDDPWKMYKCGYWGLKFSVFKFESISGYPFWRWKRGPACTKWQIYFGTDFKRSVKNERTRISGVELFGFEIREHIWIPILEMQVWPLMHKVTNWFRDSFRMIREKRIDADNGGWNFRFWNMRAYLDTHFGDESVASDAQSDKLILGLILDDPWKSNRREYWGLKFSVLKSKSIFGYPFWRCKHGPGCKKWRIDFGTQFRRSVKN